MTSLRAQPMAWLVSDDDLVISEGEQCESRHS
jgi:hypothetical protein